MTKFGPFKPYAVFLKVGKHSYTFLGTFQYATAREALQRAREAYPLLVADDSRLIVWPWDGALISDGTKPRDELHSP